MDQRLRVPSPDPFLHGRDALREKSRREWQIELSEALTVDDVTWLLEHQWDGTFEHAR